MPGRDGLRRLEPVRSPSVTDQVFEALHRQILSLDLAPGTKVSEIDVARAFEVSRQPVRDAFFRLSQLGFLEIRPQRATVITRISETAVLRARFVRTALELACLKAAIQTISEPDIRELERLLADQEAAVAADDRPGFHALDDEFHRRMCEMAGQGHVWSLIRDQKAHMDRVRFLSLASSAQTAFADHVDLVDALRRKDAAGAEAILGTHLGRIAAVLQAIRGEHPEYFDD
ncbi:GntR family transcriptional regulator [Labrenzia sp. VG12]|uniref:GntR family transcriptional regulator n=1 Tax=Labrenzia sp. VG12 TaxID=2021862 RepID=UPI000B8C6672|nr:GntR family transcriptional regulator [Labrenzia sp. VG12]ASP34230.1 GntR family transcriptional regulator [Labrenzia sp. VG12]